MKRQFSACQTPRCIYPSMFNSFPVIRTASAKNRRFYVPQPTFLFPLETPLRLSRNMFYGWKNSMLFLPHYCFPWGRPWGNHAKCYMDGKRIRCLQIAITVSQIERDIGQKSSFFQTPLHSTPPLRGFPSEHRHPVRYGKTRMAWLPDGGKISKISLFVLAQLTNVTDGRTDTGWRHIPRLCIASRCKKHK